MISQRYRILRGILIGGAAILVAPQPSWAASSQVTGINVSPTSSGVDIVLELRQGSSQTGSSQTNASTNAASDRPQVFTLSQGNSWIANITNAQLSLPNNSQDFRQDNPTAGIASIRIVSSGTNSIQVTVTGQASSPAGQVSQQDQGKVTLSLLRSLPTTQATQPTRSTSPAIPLPKPTSPPAQPSPPATKPTTPTAKPTAPTAKPATPAIDDDNTEPAIPAPPSRPVAPSRPVTSPPTAVPISPPTPAAAPSPPTPTVAPAVSPQPNLPTPAPSPQPPSSPPPTVVQPPSRPTSTIPINTGNKLNTGSKLNYNDISVTPAVVDLGTNARITRVVLRETPVREVLALLANTAGLGIVYTEDLAAPATPGAGQPGSVIDSVISLDIQNESVQDVFNYVLQSKGLRANRVNKTIFVGQNLPATAGNYIARTVRLNQMQATLPQTNVTTTMTSASSLNSGGGQQGGSSSTNSQVGRSSTTTENVPIKGALQILEELGANNSTTAKSPALRGLQVTADSRTNTLTLLGSPALVQTATDYLTTLDVRQRQVAVNVKIVEVNLSRTSNIGASFSFGIADNFFSVNQGQGTANVGPVNPSLENNTTSLTSPSTIANPFAGVQPPLNTNAPVVNSQGTTLGFQPASPTNANPLAAVVTNLIGGSVVSNSATSTVINQALTYGLPPLFQFPARFLLNLQAQVVSGNAKILTDPTLIVQEGSQSQVNLTAQVFSGFTEQIQQQVPGSNVPPTTRILPLAPIDVGVILNVKVERIDDNDFVTLEVSPEVSSLGQQITDPSRNNLLIQQLVNRRRLETGRIRLRNGQTLILTGIIQDQDRVTVTKVPILGDIPLLNLLFRNKRTQHDRNEVIVLVTPQILDENTNTPYGFNYTPGADIRKFLQQSNPRPSNPTNPPAK